MAYIVKTMPMSKQMNLPEFSKIFNVNLIDKFWNPVELITVME